MQRAGNSEEEVKQSLRGIFLPEPRSGTHRTESIVILVEELTAPYQFNVRRGITFNRSSAVPSLL